MATRSAAFIALPAAFLALAALASCGGAPGGNSGSDGKTGNGAAANSAQADVAVGSVLFADNFKGVCSGASVSTATAYDRAASTHKALYFTTYKDGLTDRSSSLPGDWTVTFSPDSDALRAVDLVACARRTAAREVRICDGYKEDGKASENKVRWHTATYELSVREARTGRELAKTTVEATDSACPMFMMFDGAGGTVDDYAALSDTAVADFLRPHITR